MKKLVVLVLLICSASYLLAAPTRFVDYWNVRSPNKPQQATDNFLVFQNYSINKIPANQMYTFLGNVPFQNMSSALEGKYATNTVFSAYTSGADARFVTKPHFAIYSTNRQTEINGKVGLVAAAAPIVSSGGTTPVISIAAATTSVPGYLTSADWNTFNGKQPAGSYLTGNQTITLSGDATGSGTTSIAVNVGKINGNVVDNSTVSDLDILQYSFGASKWLHVQPSTITAGNATKLATGRTISLTGGVTYTSPSFDGSGNVTAVATVVTNANLTGPITSVGNTTGFATTWNQHGTFSVNLTATTPPTVPVTTTATYTRIDNQITVGMFFANVSMVGASGNVSIAGIPAGFVPATTNYAGACTQLGFGTFTAIVVPQTGSTAFALLNAQTIGSVVAVPSVGVYLICSVTYSI